MNAMLLAMVAMAAVTAHGDFKAGVARRVITPVGPVWMSGFAARTHPSEGVVHDLWTKSLALEDPQGERLVVVTTDVIGLPRELSEEVALRLREKCGLQRRQVLFSSSHTHAGPIIWGNLTSMFAGTAEEKQKLIDYRHWLAEQLVAVAEAALADLRPAGLAIGHGAAGFATNRRERSGGTYRIGVNPDGPVDHDVPVICVTALDGKPRAVLFGYACHNTTLKSDCYRMHGDYAGYAQIEIEKAMPGVTALFAILCGGDQNANPRGTPELAAQYGKDLADEVHRVISDQPRPLTPALRTAFEEVQVEVAHQDRSVFEAEAKSSDRFRRARAEAMLAAIDAGQPVWSVSVPVHAVALADKVALVAIGGEVVVDYGLRLKREYANTDLVVAGYANSVPCYIPSCRVLKEGGYEPVDSMIYYGHPGPFTENVEDTVIAACHRVLTQVGIEAGSK